MKRHRSYGILFLLALASTSASAAAEKPKAPAPAPTTSDGYNYTFTDEALLAGATGVTGMPITIRPGGARAPLIRPRTAFIVELLKSVENL